ncbi:MAG: IS200/IS605 family accessory protein TnpB-related protein [Cyanobacteria bacterium P01_H01_bin.35]
MAKINENKPQGFWSKKLANITEKRNCQMRDAVNKRAKLVVNHCLKYRIGRIIFGWNKGQKDGIIIGGKNSKKLVQIPTAKLKEGINQLCKTNGIEFVETEESYTSQASFLDDDLLPKIGEKPDSSKPKSFGHASRFMSRSETGKRIERGLYRTQNGLLVNADVNGAGNILKYNKFKIFS